VGYLNLVAIKSKTSSVDQEEVLDVALLLAMCPFLAAGHKQTAPLPLVVVVMVQMRASAGHFWTGV
jgi:hypothetical protein